MQILLQVLDRRIERAERRTKHIADLRRRAAEADARLKRLYDAIESGIADLADPMLKERIGELKAVRDQAIRPASTRSGLRRRSISPTLLSQPHALATFARTARKRMQIGSGGYRCDHLHALVQRVEVDEKEIRIMGFKSVLLRTLVAASSIKVVARVGFKSLR
jgi:hypothetical protein